MLSPVWLPVWLMIAGLYGLAIGSFLNVVIWRLPRGGSISEPTWSYCPRCKHRLGAVDLFPVFSFMLLGAKCRYCRAPISWRYPGVELLTSVLFAAVTWYVWGAGAPHAKRGLSPEEWLELSVRHPGLQGIKVAGGDGAWYRDMAPVMKRLSVFIPGHFLATGLAQGAQGSYSNVACLRPAGAQRWYAQCLSDPAAARSLQEKIGRFLFGEVVPYAKAHGLSNMACDKALAAAGGWLPGLSPLIRWPYAAFPAAEVERLAAAARLQLPELF